MKRYGKLIAAFVFVALVAGAILWFTGRDTGNQPYDPGTPIPPDHKGTFVSDEGTMIFNGDGESITIDFSEHLAELTGLPAGKHEGTYVFLSGSLPPHGSVDVRYDVAHELKITVGGVSAVINVGMASDDGSSGSVGVNMVTETRIPMLFKVDKKYFNVTFLKQ